MRCELTIFGKPPAGLSRKDFTKLWRHLTSLRDRRFDVDGNSVDYKVMHSCMTPPEMITTKFIVVKLLRGEFTLMIAGKGYTVPELISQMEVLYYDDCTWKKPIYPELGPMVEVDLSTAAYVAVDEDGDIHGFNTILGIQLNTVIYPTGLRYWESPEWQDKVLLCTISEFPTSIPEGWCQSSLREVPRV